MNLTNTPSAVQAANLTGKEYHVVKLVDGGVDIAASGDEALVIGTLLRASSHQEDGVYVGKACAVQLSQGSIHYAVIGGSSAAIDQGDGLILDSVTPGRLVPSESNPIARSWDNFTAANGAIVQVVFL